MKLIILVRKGRVGSSSANISGGERLLSTLLTEMDGLENAKGILVLAATNRLEAIDPALKRPGCFDLVLEVPPPDVKARYDILCVDTKTMNLGNDVDLRQIAAHTELFTGVDLKGLSHEAGFVALREDISAAVVHDRHFQTQLKVLIEQKHNNHHPGNLIIDGVCGGQIISSFFPYHER